VDDHALAVDVAELETGDFGAPHAGAVENHKQSSLEKVLAGVDQARNFFLAQDVR
jgi:hypothetical protein